ncbi:hypothetical protein K432DRAFT_386935 [Lepidopterella palustris CBS 459.81]|uniref:Uncharacterized protein n=1 Tax=Lepidopterella palustris CBS 459.81 TaxID=1314670 RepID=A0A8E2DYV9_9PEZI|nr:hypothetical protein K432DRAFT_386935 [Lepidopterella palustris CBS 459.81]
MSTEFLTLLPPQGITLSAYDRTKRSSDQPASIPQPFIDAMSVREAVYVDEQGVPLENEMDEDDARSWHWVVYASVGTSSPPPEPKHTKGKESKEEEERRRSSATASRTPVATIRLIPPPHGPNPYLKMGQGHGQRQMQEIGAEEVHAKNHDKHPDAEPSSPTHAHPTEPYLKLGRLATLSAYRKLGLSRLLINAALEWASSHPQYIGRQLSPATMEAAKLLGRVEGEQWKGLTMVHAQTSVEGLWARFGFREELVREDGSVEVAGEGRWWEEGIEHLGMWRRLKIKDSR